MGLALEIDPAAIPFNSQSIFVALPTGSDMTLGRHIGQAVLLFVRSNGRCEVLGCATLLEIAVSTLGPAGDFAELEEIRWLADPVEYPMPSALHGTPWAFLRLGDFNLMLSLCKMQHSRGMLHPVHLAPSPEFDELPAPLRFEVIRRAAGRCQLTGLSGDDVAASVGVFATIIRPVALGGLHNPLNYLALSESARSAFKSLHLAVATQNQLVFDGSKIDMELRNSLNQSGYLWRPIDATESELEANLAWHFGEFLRPLLRPLLI